MTAPLLDTSYGFVLPAELEGAENPTGIAVSNLIPDGAITSTDGAAVKAIAITGLDTSLGAWQYSLDGGTTWLTVDASAINSTTNELALLLGPTAMVRLLPFGNLSGTLSEAITFRAWDESSGSQGQYMAISSAGGSTAFSSESGMAASTVTAVNQTPVFDSQTDPSGEISTNVQTGAILVGPDGKIVVAGDVGLYTSEMGVQRFNPDGSPDTGFNITGSQLVGISNGNLFGTAVSLLPDGHIVVAGFTDAGGMGARPAIAYFNSDGTIATEFGQSGLVLPAGPSLTSLDGETVQPDGKLVVVGTSFASTPGSFVVERFSVDGTADASFNGTGIVSTEFGSGTRDQATAVVCQSDGKLIVVGESISDWPLSHFAIARYNADGTLDTSFHGTGELVPDFGGAIESASGVTLQSDGKILVVGSTSVNGPYNLALMRLNPDGSLDSTFNGTGLLVATFPNAVNVHGERVAIAPDGKIVVVATADGSGTSGFVVARYNQDGSVDKTFNGSGEATINAGSGTWDLAVQPDGKIVVLGATTIPSEPFAVVARFNVDGSLDPTFAQNGSPPSEPVDYYYSGDKPLALDAALAVYDPDLTGLDSGSGNYAGAILTLSRIGGPDASDQFFGVGQLVLGDTTVTEGGVLIGTCSNAAGVLSITFNSNATQALVNQAISGIGYANSLTAPTTTVELQYLFSDGNTGAQGSGPPLTATTQVAVEILAPPNLVLSGGSGPDNLVGGLGNDFISGYAGNDTLIGGAGNDTLIGGAGVDSMDGGQGSDLYVINVPTEHTAAEIHDSGVTGTDEVRFAATTASTLTLFAGDTGIERVVIGTGADPVADTSGTTALNVNAAAVKNGLTIIGNAGTNQITGTAFADTIDGGGGADTLIGGNGNDTYIIESSADKINETSTGGIDKVLASVSYVLPSNVENLVLTGSPAINGTGNALANTIIGNAARNVIDGKGGIDHLDGGDGSDVYLVDTASDHSAAEFADSGTTGTDEVRFTASSGTVTLFAGDTGIERVVIGTGTAATPVTTGTGSANVNASAAPDALTIIGNAGKNVLIGTAFNDTLLGGGGNDTLTGGGGADTFVFNTTPNASSNKVTIKDFTSGSDVLQFGLAIYKAAGVAPGPIDPSEFWSSPTATAGHASTDRFIYNTTTGVLYYDADGNGPGAAVAVAVLGTTTHPVLTATDILLSP